MAFTDELLKEVSIRADQLLPEMLDEVFSSLIRARANDIHKRRLSNEQYTEQDTEYLAMLRVYVHKKIKCHRLQKKLEGRFCYWGSYSEVDLPQSCIQSVEQEYNETSEEAKKLRARMREFYERLL